MTGVLARLVLRAHGGAPAGLRPRLPARFDTASTPQGPEGTGLATKDADARTAPPGWIAPEAAPPRDSTPIAEAIAGRPLAPGPVDPPSPGIPPARRAAPDASEAFDVQEQRAAQAGPRQPTLPPAAAIAAEAGWRPAASRPALAEPEPAADDTPQPAAAGSRGPRPSPPEPLMPIAPQITLPPAEPALAAPRPSPAAETGRRAGPAAPAPEIVIHIGRIDLTAAPAPVAKPRPLQARPPMTSLADYLRRDGDGR